MHRRAFTSAAAIRRRICAYRGAALPTCTGGGITTGSGGGGGVYMLRCYPHALQARSITTPSTRYAFRAVCCGAAAQQQRNFSSTPSRRYSAAKAPSDPYKVLGVDRKASAADIKKAYFQLARKYHPDAIAKTASAAEKESMKEKFMAVQEAYDTLGDEKKRAAFDQFGHQGAQMGGGGPGGFEGFGGAQAGGYSAEDILRSFFGRHGMGNDRGPSSPFGGFDAESIFGNGARSRGASAASQMDYEGGDVVARLSIGFMEAIKGTRRAISYAAYRRCGTCSGSGLKPGRSPAKCKGCGGSGEQVMSRGGFRIVMQCQVCGGVGQSVQPSDTCTTCRGDGKVKERQEITVTVPPGVDNGEKLRMSGRGHAAPAGRPGDLFITIQVQPPTPSEQIFKRSGADITVETPIPFYQAITGTTTKVPTIDGGYVDIKIPPGTQPNTRRVLVGRGVQKLSQPAGIKGDQIIILKVTIPSAGDLNAEQRRAVEEFPRLGRDATVKRDFHSHASNATDSDQKNAERDKVADSEPAQHGEQGFLKKTLNKIKDTLCDADSNTTKKAATQ